MFGCNLPFAQQRYQGSKLPAESVFQAESFFMDEIYIVKSKNCLTSLALNY
ncbi:hypothetical protein HMPREF1981_00955 [Bacteroides pyogenes F0041]|uniref:Uncharacterized protein n=1 Tax=Bacteroides pyogenes F0041 TaxID=1321819 RepID=U2C7A2_9BACE|nr:hypothetical protein HMPREF1981_00955 [Bacteroides pyogenes F0041]